MVEALKVPAAYESAVGERVPEVRHEETHISHLFFAGDRVFKIKKHVRFEFLDYSTIERRRRFCEEEVRLNRRLAPEVYLGAVPVTGSVEDGLRIEGEGDPVAWAVKMVRLPSDRMLDALLDSDDLCDRRVDKLVETLVRFHADAETGETVDRHGTPTAVADKVKGNLRQTEELVERGALSSELVRWVSSWAVRFVEGQREMFEQRVRTGRLRDGHGDLHAGNICFVPETLCDKGIAIYDCIEFSRALRCGDVASDLGFLAMDLDRRGYAELSDRLVRRYVEGAGDPGLRGPLDLYKCHRAAVRAKVTALKDSDPGRRREAHGYLQLAASYGLPPALILTCGLPGTGKSWLARRLAGPLGAVVLRSDVTRKRLAGFRPHQSASAAYGEGLYDETMTRRTYARLLERALELIRSGRSVIVDAAFPTRRRRAPFVEAAAREAVTLRVVGVSAPEPVVRRRLERRDRDPSDAGIEVYRRARKTFEPADELDDRRVHVVSGRDASVDVADRLLRSLITAA